MATELGVGVGVGLGVPVALAMGLGLGLGLNTTELDSMRPATHVAIMQGGHGIPLAMLLAMFVLGFVGLVFVYRRTQSGRVRQSQEFELVETAHLLVEEA